MKLYATTTSERASKGQGGNKNLLTVFTAEIDGQRREIASVSIISMEDSYKFSILLPDQTRIEQKVSKGKQKKGKIRCNMCMRVFTDEAQLRRKDDAEVCPYCDTDAYLMDL